MTQATNIGAVRDMEEQAKRLLAGAIGAGRLILWILRTALGPVFHGTLAVTTVALLVVLLVAAYWEATNSDDDLKGQATVAVAKAATPVRSYDGAEKEHELPWSLVATIVQQARQEEVSGVQAGAVAKELWPEFEYQTYTLTTVCTYKDEEGNTSTETTTQTVEALVRAVTFRGMYEYTYKVVSRSEGNCTVETLERESVQYTEDWSRMVKSLGGFLKRPVEEWEARWLVNMAADLGKDEPGQWLLDDDPESWWGGFEWQSTWTGGAGAGKTAPLAGVMQVTSPFGIRVHPVFGTERFHAGVDLAADIGTPVYAVMAGQIQLAGPAGGYGLAVIIDHGGGIHTVYAHLSRISVRVGQEVRAGETIGEAGSTGISTGPHLHFEVRRNGKPIEPLVWLQE